MDRSLNSTLYAAVALLLALTFSSGATAAQPAISRAPNGHAVYHVPACPGPAAAGTARCHAHVVTDQAGHLKVTAGPDAPGGSNGGKGGHGGGGGGGGTPAPPSGFGPATLRAAYGIADVGAPSIVIAIVDANGYSNAETDLATYRTQFGLQAMTSCSTWPPSGDTPCFKKVNQDGFEGSYPRDDTGWSQETALDLDMASAMCPRCSILLVEANSATYGNLATAVATAGAMGAYAISNSYGGSELGSSAYASAYSPASYSSNPVITASSGDSGYGVSFPASSDTVIAVGGTSLTVQSNGSRTLETAWSGAGSGCSSLYPKPTWQTDKGCANRTVADVSAVADPATGVAVYAPVNRKSSGWLVFGGTSVSAPLIAGVFAANGQGIASSYGAWGDQLYGTATALYDVKSGSNGSCGGSYLCTAVQGYDGPTGLGTPNGDSAF